MDAGVDWSIRGFEGATPERRSVSFGSKGGSRSLVLARRRGREWF